MGIGTFYSWTDSTKITRKYKNVHNIVIEGCQFQTQLRYYLNTHTISVSTGYSYTSPADNKVYRKINDKKIKTNKKVYYQANKDKLLLYCKKWREINKDTLKIKKQKYHFLNKEKYNNRSKANYYTNRDPNTPHQGSLEWRIQISCRHQGIEINEWDGFISNQKYCEKFNESLREEIRNKYNNCDYISGIHKDICNNGRSLDVHHVDYNKQQGCDDHQWKLIPLSKVNHARTNANRPFWNRLFTYSLQYEKEYYGDE